MQVLLVRVGRVFFRLFYFTIFFATYSKVFKNSVKLKIIRSQQRDMGYFL